MYYTSNQRAARRGAKTAVVALRSLAEAGACLGLDVDGARALAGIPESALQVRWGYVDTDAAHAFAAELSRQAGPIPIGIRAAERLSYGDLGILDVLPACAADLREAATLGSRYYGIIDGTAALHVAEEGRHGVLRVVPTGAPIMLPVFAEQLVACLTILTRRITGRDVAALEVRFAHELRGKAAEYERFFRAPVVFGAEYAGTLFPREFLDLPVVSSNAALKTGLTGCAQLLLEQIGCTDEFVEGVRERLREGLREGDVSVARIAAELSLSGRTLQRRLQQHGKSLNGLLDEVRRDLGLRYVADGHLSVQKIARSLGFTDASAFARAFRRWTQVSPSAFRNGAEAPHQG